jgi:membrane-associated phospholipid phosphatase
MRVADVFLFEWLAGAYASAFVIVALVVASVEGRLRATTMAAGLLLGVLIVATQGSLRLRLMAPHVYLLVGYWLPGLIVRGRVMKAFDFAFESWLRRSDAAIRPRLPALPAWLSWPLELAYLFCYPLVPLAFLLVWARGTTEDVARLWLLVLSAGYACYATLPWMLSRPPRALEAGPHGPGGVRALNRFVLGRFSHTWNTFPSGHVAVTAAAAFVVWQVWPSAGVVVGVLALGVGLGAAAGRYHYVVDVVAGLLVAALAVLTGWSLES